MLRTFSISVYIRFFVRFSTVAFGTFEKSSTLISGRRLVGITSPATLPPYIYDLVLRSVHMDIIDNRETHFFPVHFLTVVLACTLLRFLPLFTVAYTLTFLYCQIRTYLRRQDIIVVVVLRRGSAREFVIG